MTSPTENQKPIKPFLDLIYKTSHIFGGFEQLSSSIGWRVMTCRTWANPGTWRGQLSKWLWSGYHQNVSCPL